MRVTFMAAPLTARSGVYRSARELVNEGRRQGLDWSLRLGVSGRAGGEAPIDDPAWIHEYVLEPAGLGGIRSLSRSIRDTQLEAKSDVIVSLTPQSDMALALRGAKNWIAYTRGLPWPAAGEAPVSRTMVWRFLERAALARAREVWATTEVLARDINLGREIRLMPPGIASVDRIWDGHEFRGDAVWAARYNEDKNPFFFLDVVRGQGYSAKMFGSGRLQDEIRRRAPSNVEISGWTSPDRLWDSAFAYVGTSYREAFGRSAVEAAMSGIPVVLADTFGCAPFLVTDPDLRNAFVLPLTDESRWKSALSRLANDTALRTRFSDHVEANARELTVERSVEGIAARLTEIID